MLIGGLGFIVLVIIYIYMIKKKKHTNYEI